MIRVGLLALAILSAGCIALPEDPNEPVEREPTTGGAMTASETTKENSAVCTDGGNLLSERRFCAERVITVTGKVSGFDLLDVALETFNGDIEVDAGSGDAWGFVATLKARGASAAAAEAALDEIAFRWAHEDADGHFVEVVAEHDGEANDLSAEISLTIPASQLMRLTASTSNGDVTLDGGRTDGVALATSNGDIVANAGVTQVSLTTSNGKIDAALEPIDSGDWQLVTSNGDIALKVPEGPKYGYAIEGTTSNGEVDYTLRDGTKGDCPEGSEYYTPPCNHRTFETSDIRSRDHRVDAGLVTSNGEITAGPK